MIRRLVAAPRLCHDAAFDAAADLMLPLRLPCRHTAFRFVIASAILLDLLSSP